MDRQRMLDMDRRLRPVRMVSFAAMACTIAACGPWLGWWPVSSLLVAVVLFKLADGRTSSSSKPEYVLFGTWAGAQLMIASSVAMTGGPESPLMATFVVPAVTLTSRFSGRGIFCGTILTFLLIFLVAVGIEPSVFQTDPPAVIVPAGLFVSVTVLSIALMRSDQEHRSEIVIDDLTGLLNRRALKQRTDELAVQSEMTGEPIGVIVADIDHFKTVNDLHGHAVGDEMLRAAARVIRSELRAFDLAYRIGGEEFLVILPGANVAEACEIAENLRIAIKRDAECRTRFLTLSFGVSASERGTRFDYDTMFEVADSALYEAKRGGRDRVEVARSGEPAPATVDPGTPPVTFAEPQAAETAR
jgi:diguanylate cyclase (GGDEF)-like protein